MRKFFKRLGIALLALVLLFEAGLLLTGNWYVNKVLAMTIFSGKLGPDIDELDKFPRHEVSKAAPQPWPVSTRYNKQQLPAEAAGKMGALQTVAYLVIKNDSLLHEQYWEGYNEHSLANSFSMAKSITGILVGCALKDGLIKSIDEPVGNYLPAFKEGKKSNITIRHLLTMSSGLDFKEEYISPFAWPAEAYYGPDVNALTLKANAVSDPGKVWFYKGGDTQLLGMILRKVTGKPLAEYASEKLWKPMGAEDAAFWSTDEQGMEKVSCCWYTNARDFARIARLMMQQGRWNGQQLADSFYMAESVLPVALVKTDGQVTDQYGFQWWLMKHKGHRIFYMRGIRGQYVFAIPDLRLIVVRFGHKRASKQGDELPSDIFVYLDAAIEMG